MARVQAADHLQGFRFHVTAILAVDNIDPLALNVPNLGQAGFQSVTAPEKTNDAVEYREGIDTYTKKFLGPPTWSDVDFMRGVTRTDTTFFDWAKRAESGEEVRADVTIYHFARGDWSQAADKGKAPAIPYDSISAAAAKAKKYVLHNAMPSRCKFAGDMDATAGDISIAEMSCAYEYAEIEPAT